MERWYVRWAIRPTGGQGIATGYDEERSVRFLVTDPFAGFDEARGPAFSDILKPFTHPVRTAGWTKRCPGPQERYVYQIETLNIPAGKKWSCSISRSNRRNRIVSDVTRAQRSPDSRLIMCLEIEKPARRFNYRPVSRDRVLPDTGYAGMRQPHVEFLGLKRLVRSPSTKAFV